MTSDQQFQDLLRKMNAFEKRAINAEEELTRVKEEVEYLKGVING